MPVCLTGFIYQLSTVEKQKAFSTSYAFGLGWFGAGISWVHVSIADFGGLPLIGSLGLMALLVGYLALFPAIAGYLLKRYFVSDSWPLAFPFIWLFFEWLRSWLLTGFPWLSLGYSQTSGPLSGWMPVMGEFGVSGLVIMLCAALATLLPKKQFKPSLLLGFIVLVGGWNLNHIDWVSEQDNPVSVAMVQGNIKQELRWVPEQDRPTMEKYWNMTQEHWQNDIIIWPEAAIPKLEPIARNYLRELDELAAQHRTGLITGIVNYNFETREAFNNLVVVGAKEQGDNKGQYRYFHNNRFAKHHLLPIGEFIPMEDWLRGLAPIFDLPMSSFSRGDYRQQNLLANGYHLSPAICFEIAFPRQIQANLYAHTDFIITVSNDAWFGNSHGPAQHLEIAQARAKEFGLPVLRATNNGITAFIDHKGEIQSRLPQFQSAVLSDSITLTQGHTPYRQYGDLIPWLLALIAFIAALRIKKQSKS